ncbi:MAG: spore cortex-lytic enzyme [Christensenellaceae bacterium]|jgi:N-acetylmuramoyl-L-alanine amidase|nr:spore cortex-lytic enzyme [Christensenellaceae bacterium]
MKIKVEREVAKKFIALLIATLLISISLFFYFQTLSTTHSEAASVKQGDKGETVKSIQTKLSRLGYYSGSIDGIYGSSTTKAVKVFQMKNGLKQDGIVGTKTAKALGINLTGALTNNNDVYLIARCVHGEARGEPYTGQVAVAAVVLNRVRSAQFPNTISGVIYQPLAFTCVSDGQINLTPNDSALRAAHDALNGWDPTSGCLFYYNPKTATSAWMRTKTTYLTIGRHVFCL